MSDVADLLATIAGEDEWSRHAALERLRAEGLPEAGLHALRDALGDDGDASRRSAARMALSALAAPESPAGPAARALLADALGSSHVDLRVLAASALGEAGSPEAVEELIAALRDPHPNVVAAAADALGVLRHPAAIGPLSELVDRGDFWSGAAAVVSLGRIRDPRAIPVLDRAADDPDLHQPVVEALRTIDEAAALPVLARLADPAGLPALLAAGAILCSHPDVSAPAWVAEHASRHAEELWRRLDADDDPAAARLLAAAADVAAVEALLDRVAPPRSSEAALAGILAAPGDTRAESILPRLGDVDAATRVTLLSLLPPLEDPERIRCLVPFLDDPEPAVRAAAAESLARAHAPHSLPLFRSHLERGGPSPEVLRAMGGLGVAACLSLTPRLGDEDPAVRAAAADAIARCGGREVAGAIADALERETEPRAQAALLRALGSAAGGGALDRLGAALQRPEPELQIGAIEGLAATGDPRALDHFRRVLEQGTSQRVAVLRAVGDLGAPGGADLLVPYLESDDEDARRVSAAAAVALAEHMPDGAVDRMRQSVDEWVRICAARILGRRGPAARDPLLRLASDDPAPAVRAVAREVMQGAA